MANKNFPMQGTGTVAVHGGNEPDPMYSHITPIYASSTFYFDSAEQGMQRFAGEDKTQIYTRLGNPAFKVAEQKIAALEARGLQDGHGNPLQLKALLHASGQAAMATLFLSTCKAGDKILSHYSLYGGTQELLTKVLQENNIEIIIADLRNPEEAAAAMETPGIRLVHIETPANPTLSCVDLDAISALAKTKGLLVSVDNTFASPYLQQPFAYAGVDFVFHSTTKYLNGHGSAIGGILLGRDLEFMKTRVWKWHTLLGGNANPFDCYLLIQGIKTLELRMERHCSNAEAVAHFLAAHEKVEKVMYVGLPSHPDHELAKKQMHGFGGMLSFEVKGGLEAGVRFINQLQLCTRAVSLGTLDTLVSHPASMSHVGIPKPERESYGITDGLIRMSVGIENIEDILADLDAALNN